MGTSAEGSIAARGLYCAGLYDRGGLEFATVFLSVMADRAFMRWTFTI